MRQDVHVDLFHTGVWNVITDDIYARDQIQVTHGRGDEWTTAGPSTVSMTADNRDGTYNPRNPASALYGKVGRNTPLRVYLGTPHPGEAASSLSASTSHVAPSVDAPTSSGILICGWSGPFPSGSYTAPGSMTESLDLNDSTQTMMVAREVVSSAGATGTRTATASASETWLACSVLIHGPTSLTTGAVGGSDNITVDGNQGDWWVLFSSFGWDDEDVSPLDYPWDTDGGGWILLADTGTINSGDSDAAFNRMKVWGKQVKVTDSVHTINVASDVDSTLSWLTRVPAAEIDSVWSIRAHGEVSSWTPRRAIKGDAWTSLAVAGPLRRLGQGTPPVRSAATRTVASGDPPAGFWPLEGGTTSVALPCVAGSSSAAVLLAGASGATFGDQTPPAGSEPLATFGPAVANVSGSGTLTPSVGTVRATIDPVLSDSAWSFGFVMRAIVPQAPGGTLMWHPVWIDVGASFIYALVYTSYSGGAFGASQGIDINGLAIAGTVAAGVTFEPWEDAAWHVYWVDVSQSGGNIQADLYIDNVLRDSRTQAGTLSRPLSWRGPLLGDGTIDAVADNNIGSSVSVGHVIFADATHGPTRTEYYDAVTGYPGEPAGERFLRLCREEAITAAVVGDPGDTVPMGPQFPDTLLNLLREVEATDDGLLADAREFLGVSFRTGRSLYDQGAALTIDHDAFELAPVTDPVLDDQATHNDVTASRRGGSTARMVQESGPLNVNPPEDDAEGVGRYTHQVDVNAFSDLVLGDYAGWHLHRGTVDETRWPTVTIDLDATPDLAESVSAVNVGDRIVVTNMPADLSPDDVSLIVIGYSETIGTHRRLVTFTCIPESQFHVAEVEHDDYSFVGSDGSTVDASFDAGTDTALDVAVAAGYPLWDDGDAPFDILVSGVRLTVTAISGSSSPQTFTVTQTPVNGVMKTIPAGERVDVFHKSYIGL